MAEKKDPKLVSEKKAAELADLSPRTLRNYRHLQCGPPFVKLAHGRCRIYYIPSEVRSWRKGRR